MSAAREALLALALRKGVLIAAAESCTGGLLGACLTRAPGSSAAFERGFVTYSNAAKIEMLGVDPAAIEAEGAVSETVAWQMAQGALARSRAQLAVSITGVAGPGGTAHKPEGRVCFGLAALGGLPRAETVEFGAIGRDRVRDASIDHALSMLRAALEAMPDRPTGGRCPQDGAD